jgi:ribosomal protein S18 acetylase RimI-like enzyme
MQICRLTKESYPDLLSFIQSVDSDFIPTISSRVDIDSWIQKVLDKGIYLGCISGSNLIGIVAFYANDNTTHHAWLVYFAVSREHREKGVSQLLMDEVISHCVSAGMTKLITTTELHNSSSIRFYEKRGFVKQGVFYSKAINAMKVRLELSIYQTTQV